LSEARRALEQGAFVPQLRVRDVSGNWEMVRIPAPVIESAATRHALFEVLRLACDKGLLTAVVVVTDSWIATLTPDGLALACEPEGEREIERLAREHKFREMVERGLATREQALQMVIQTPESSLVICQQYDRMEDGVVFGERREGDQVDGPMQMFGRPSGAHEAVRASRRRKETVQ
jgi:hypothetical protein